MANTTKIVDRFLQIKGLDADWSLSGDLAGFLESGINVKSITFYPSAANDILIIKAGKPSYTTTALAIVDTLTAPEIFVTRADILGKSIRIEFGGKGRRMWPFIDISDCTFGTAANARVEFELA